MKKHAEVWSSVQKQGNRRMFTVTTRDEKMHNMMIYAPHILEELISVRNTLQELHQGVEINLTRKIAATDAVIAKAKGE